MKVNLFDSHVHSDNSVDGHHAITYICEQAIQNRIMGLAITDHFECDGDVELQEKGIRQSAFDLERARTAFGSQIRLSKGIELAQGYRCPEVAQRLLSLTDYDYVLGSIHTDEAGMDYYFADFNQPNLVVGDLLRDYFDMLVKQARWGQFDAMAHIRYPERYIWGRCRIPVDIHPYLEQIEELFRLLIQNGKALEVNTSAFRQGAGGIDPGLDLLTLYRQMGGELITLGSDAHLAQHLTSGFDDAMDMLLKAGFRYFAFYSKRQPVMLRIL